VIIHGVWGGVPHLPSPYAVNDFMRWILTDFFFFNFFLLQLKNEKANKSIWMKIKNMQGLGLIGEKRVRKISCFVYEKFD